MSEVLVDRELLERIAHDDEGLASLADFEELKRVLAQLAEPIEPAPAQTEQQPEQSGLVEALYHLSDVWAINADEHKEYGRFDEAEVLRRASRELRNALSATPSPATVPSHE